MTVNNDTRILPEHAQAYITGGKAVVIFHNTATGNKRMFYVWKNEKSSFPQWYVYHHPDHKTYLGKLEYTPVDSTLKYYPGLIKLIEPELVQRTQRHLQACFKAMWQRIQNPGKLEPFVHIYHDGRCSVCNRPLTDVESLQRGIGPKCAGIS